MNPFLDCPVYETEHFIIRKLKREDAEALFSCYSDPDAARFFNGDCCEDDFYYTDLEKFKGCVDSGWSGMKYRTLYAGVSLTKRLII